MACFMLFRYCTAENSILTTYYGALPKRQKMDLFSKLKMMRILLIDDDEWIRDSLSLYFEGEGCH